MKFASIALLAIAARLIMLLFVRPGEAGDTAYYLAAADSLWQTGQLPDLHRPPLYSLFVAAFLNVGAFIYVAQSALTVGLALLCLRLTGSFWGAALIAACPILVAYDYWMLSESLLACLLTAGWLLLDKGKAAWAGLCVGLAILTRDTFILLPLFALPVGWYLGRGRQFMVMAVLSYIVVLPSPLYNWAIHDRFRVSEGRFGYNLWIGTWERDEIWYADGLDRAQYPPNAFRSSEERRYLLGAFQRGEDRLFRDVAVDRVVSDPLGTSIVWAQRYWRLWLGTRSEHLSTRMERGSAAWTAFKAGMWGLNLLVLLGGISAMFATRRWIYAIPIAYIAAVYVPFHNVETRYSLPAIPFLLIVAGLWLDRFVRLPPTGRLGKTLARWESRASIGPPS